MVKLREHNDAPQDSSRVINQRFCSWKTSYGVGYYCVALLLARTAVNRILPRKPRNPRSIPGRGNRSFSYPRVLTVMEPTLLYNG
jgi:hypothetical protein